MLWKETNEEKEKKNTKERESVKRVPGKLNAGDQENLRTARVERKVLF